LHVTLPRVRRILVIDDEPLIGMMIRRTLEPAYEVTVLTSGRAALEKLTAGARYDAIVSDLHMDDGDGQWLHAQLTLLDPAQARRMLFLSGAPHPFLDRPGVRSLAKPFRAAELIEQIEAAATS
jgi:CheY-like chemotaxis protein